MPLTGTHLWADRFDGSLEDVFELQDKVAISVAGVIEPALQAAEIAPFGRPADRPISTAYDLYLRAYAMLLVDQRRARSSKRSRTARTGDRDATRITGRRSPGRRSAVMRLVTDGSEPKIAEADRRKGIDLARRASKSAGDDPGILANAAFALAYFGEDIGAMIGAGRSRAGAQPELRARLAHQRRSQAMGRPTRPRDRACRDLRCA